MLTRLRARFDMAHRSGLVALGRYYAFAVLLIVAVYALGGGLHQFRS